MPLTSCLAPLSGEGVLRLWALAGALATPELCADHASSGVLLPSSPGYAGVLMQACLTMPHACQEGRGRCSMRYQSLLSADLF